MSAAAAVLARALLDDFEFDWQSIARPEQLPLADDEWSTWLILAGRGFGKTRTGAETVRSWATGSTPHSPGRYGRLALVAETAADARDVMVEGESGILAVHPPDFRPTYEPSKRKLTWPNGATALLFNGTEPDQLRGPQFDAAWVDELAKYEHAADVWDQLAFSLRLAKQPHKVVTTTPRPIPVLKAIIVDPTTRITRGRTLDNAVNLAPGVVEALMKRYAGTRFGRQELEAELLTDTPGALWRWEDIEEPRIKAALLPPLKRVVVAVDPAVTSGEDADETGIIVAGIDERGHAYVLEDLSGRFTPDAWARKAVGAYHTHRADRIVASRGKVVRAEPVSALHKQRRVHHAGVFPQLEEQMSAFTADFNRGQAGYSPDRVDALVWALSELMLGPEHSFSSRELLI